MRFFLRIGSLVASASLLFLSCEKHHVGELPHYPSADKTDAHDKSPSPVPMEAAHDQKSHGDSGAATSPTPVEFFPQSTPR